MLLSIDTNALRDRFDDQTAIRMIAAAGFDAFDYSMFRATGERDMLGEDYRDRALRLKAVADEVGVVCRQAHAPFDFAYTDQTDLSNQNYLRLVRSLEIASVLGAKNIVVHTVKKNLPKAFDLEGFSREFYKSFIPYCEKFGINISVENLVGRDPVTNRKFPVFSDPVRHTAFVKSLGSDCFNICIDVGHSALLGYMPEDVIQAVDKRLFKTMHVSDNDFENDCHVLPYEGRINWEAVTRSLALIGFEGDFDFELEGHLKRLDDALLPAGLRFAAATGRVLMEKIEQYKREM